MSTKYQRPYGIPEHFPALLKGFTREVLRAQPENIYEFGARYFQDLLQQRTAGDAEPAPASTPQPGSSFEPSSSQAETTEGLDIASMSASELEPIMLRLFLEADTDSSGYLDRAEFIQVLKANSLNLSDRQLRQVLSEADENDDGVIEYREFLPLMIDILQSVKAKEQARALMADVEGAVRSEVEATLLRGLSRDELQQLMMRVFKKADVDGSGFLSRPEFKRALKAADLGLTRKDINLIMSQVDLNKDGLVSYVEFIPLCFQGHRLEFQTHYMCQGGYERSAGCNGLVSLMRDAKVLVERFKDELMVNDILNNQDGLQGLLLEHFQAADPERVGTLPQHAVKTVLKDLSYQALGLSTLQLVTLLSQAPMAPDGHIQYIQFIPLAAAIIVSMYNVDSMKLRVQAINQVSAAGGMQVLGHMDLDGLRSVLGEAFQAADSEATGQLQLPQVMEVLGSLDSLGGQGISEARMRAIFAAIDTDSSGTVDWAELVNFICDALEHLEREAYISQLAAQPSEGQQQGEQSQAEGLGLEASAAGGVPADEEPSEAE